MVNTNTRVYYREGLAESETSSNSLRTSELLLKEEQKQGGGPGRDNDNSPGQVLKKDLELSLINFIRTALF